jgi:hypothetical protein
MLRGFWVDSCPKAEAGSKAIRPDSGEMDPCRMALKNEDRPSANLMKGI